MKHLLRLTTRTDAGLSYGGLLCQGFPLDLRKSGDPAGGSGPQAIALYYVG